MLPTKSYLPKISITPNMRNRTISYILDDEESCPATPRKRTSIDSGSWNVSGLRNGTGNSNPGTPFRRFSIELPNPNNSFDSMVVDFEYLPSAAEELEFQCPIPAPRVKPAPPPPPPAPPAPTAPPASPPELSVNVNKSCHSCKKQVSNSIKCQKLIHLKTRTSTCKLSYCNRCVKKMDGTSYTGTDPWCCCRCRGVCTCVECRKKNKTSESEDNISSE